MNGRSHLLALIISLACLPLSAAPAVYSAEIADSRPIKIGFVVPMSGVAANGGQEMVNGINLYLDEIGHKMAGRNVQLLVENDESSAATAMSKVEKLLQKDNVQILDGFLLSNIASAIAPRLDAYGVPWIVALASSDDLTQRHHYKWLVRTGWASSQAALPFGDWVYRNLPYRRIVTFGMELPMGIEFVGGFQKSFEQDGGRIVQKIWAPMGFTDFTSYVKKIDKSADAVLVCAVNQGAALALQAYRSAGPHLPVLGGSATYDESFLNKLGDGEIGSISASVYSAGNPSPADKGFVQRYKNRYGRSPSNFSEAAYTSCMFIKAAAEAVHGDVENKEKFLAALKHAEVADAPRGPVKLDERANPIENVYVRKVEKVNGRLQNTVIDTIVHVSQFWKYSPGQYLAEPPFTMSYPPCKYCSNTP